MVNYLRIWALTSALISGPIFASTTNNTPEVMLEKAIGEIRAQNNMQALQILNELTKVYPDFQLAQLIRADLLYAQGNLLNAMGQPIDKEVSNNLQAEAQARLSAAKAPPPGTIPGYIMSLPSWLSYLITIDFSESRAYLFDIKNGQVNFITSYYFTQGKLGSGKEKEGDKRSPIGVYRLTSPIPGSRLSNFYGSGALPLDYPNYWDKRNNRTGHGIWLHGTPVGQYSRPPLASDGCVVFANDDLQQLMAKLDWRRTLVITDKQLQWQTPDEIVEARTQLLNAIEGWRDAWQAQDINKYMRYYAADFSSDKGEKYQDWQARKGQLFGYHRPHKIQLSDLLLYQYPGNAKIAVSVFNQNYQREGKSSNERKRLWWQWRDGRWQILTEEIVTP